MDADTTIRPQKGRQELFLSSQADIALYGGAAGGGKTFALLLEPVRHIDVHNFTATCFRRTYPQITSQGGLWAESSNIYPLLGARSSGLTWFWPSSASVSFRHMETEADKYEYQGSQICLMLFDQLEQFSETQFFFMLSRNRSVCGVKPYVRATANPQTGWLSDFISWWLDADGYANLDRVGKIRYMTRHGEKIIWGDSLAEIREISGDPQAEAKTVTFIPASVYDNPALLDKDPTYVSNLKALPTIERLRLLGDPLRGGNWKVRAQGGFIKREWFQIVDAAPAEAIRCRGWDLAATEKKTADWTVGTRIAKKDGIFYIEGVAREKRGPSDVIRLMRSYAESDGVGVHVAVEQEGGSSGKIAGSSIVRALAGFSIRPVPVSGDKVQRVMPFLAQAEAGNVRLVRGDWIETWLDEFIGFPDGDHDDQVDSCSVAFNYLTHGIINPSVGQDASEIRTAGPDNPADNDRLWEEIQ